MFYLWDSTGLNGAIWTNKVNVKELISVVCVYSCQGRSHHVPRTYITFLLNATEHDFFPAHNVKMPTIVGILTL